MLWTVSFDRVSDIKYNALTGGLVLALIDGTTQKLKTQENPFVSKDKKSKPFMISGGMLAGMQAAAEGNTWQILIPQLKELINKQR